MKNYFLVYFYLLYISSYRIVFQHLTCFLFHWMAVSSQADILIKSHWLCTGRNICSSIALSSSSWSMHLLYFDTCSMVWYRDVTLVPVTGKGVTCSCCVGESKNQSIENILRSVKEHVCSSESRGTFRKQLDSGKTDIFLCHHLHCSPRSDAAGSH